MNTRKTKRIVTFAAAAALALGSFTVVRAADDDASAGTPSVNLAGNPRAVAYQLKRLTNQQLASFDRKPDDPKFKPVYEALLTRKGLEKKFRQEAVEALVGLNKSDPVTVILDAVGKVDAEDKNTPRELASLLLSQKPSALAGQREKLEGLAKESESATVKQAAYAALAAADGGPDKAWELASANEGGLASLLQGMPLIPDGKLRAQFYAKVEPLLGKAPDDTTQVAAIEAVSAIPGKEADEFKILASLIKSGAGEQRAAAVRSLGRVPAAKWPADQVEAVARDTVKLVGEIPGDQRTQPQAIQAVQLGNDLAAALPPAQGAPIRKSLRELAVRVVLIHTLREQMQYDLRYFTVQAGKPVQIVLQNDDAMQHNIVITAPNGFQEIALLAGAMQPPANPEDKAFVPDNPKVLQSSHLINGGESLTLSFNAPEKPGNYPFLCTFPGHWVKMYGVMQVVPDLDAYDQNPVVPKDPVTKKPFDSQKNAITENPEGAAHEHNH
jgi:azurin